MIFRKKKTNKEPQNIEEVFDFVKTLEKRIVFLEQELKKEKQKSLNNFSKIAIKRFNPFNDMGGDQSFALTLLDNQNNGFILTSLYSKDHSRTFTKPIKNGISKYQLLKEEEQVLKKALYE